jgi:hypothetical protein
MDGQRSRRSSGTRTTSLCALTGTTHSRTRRAIRPQLAVGLLQSGELEIRATGRSRIAQRHGKIGQLTCAATQPRWPTSGDRYRRAAPCLQGLTTHSKNRVGMAGFEPAASCSQISSNRTLDVAGCCPTWRQPAVILARRSLTPFRVCGCWLPLWLPPFGRHLAPSGLNAVNPADSDEVRLDDVDDAVTANAQTVILTRVEALSWERIFRQRGDCNADRAHPILPARRCTTFGWLRWSSRTFTWTRAGASPSGPSLSSPSSTTTTKATDLAKFIPAR